MTDTKHPFCTTGRETLCFAAPVVWGSSFCCGRNRFLSLRRPRVGILHCKSLRNRARSHVKRSDCLPPMVMISESETSGSSPQQVSSPPANDGQAQAQSTTDQVRFTHMENNTLVLKYGSSTFLIDPWLTGDLIFLNPRFFQLRKGKPPNPSADPRNFDISSVTAVVLTQGLPDHAHPPTLKTFPRTIPIIAAEDAKSLLDSLGFENVTILKHGATVTAVSTDSPAETVTLTGAKGSLVGPPWSNPQLAILFNFGAGENTFRVYHEPHCNHDSEFLQKWRGNLDAVITPVKSAKLPLLGNFALVNGVPEAVTLCKDARPKVCVGFDNSGGEPVSGVLFNFVEGKGGFDDLRKAIEKDDDLTDMEVIGDVEALTELVIAGKDVGTVITKQ